MKKGLLILLALAFVVTGSTYTFAANMNKEAQVPVYLTAPGIGDGDDMVGGWESGAGKRIGGMDFSITDNLFMTAIQGDILIKIPDITVINHAKSGQIAITSIEVNPINGWIFKPDKASYFRNLQSNTKELSLVADSIHDFATDSTYNLGESKLVPSCDGMNSVSFTGHIGSFTKAASYDVASIVPTIAVY